ncbi:MAG: hypothetical protein ACXIVQ_16190 [Acidimicrobiales bacterium]
MAWFLLNGGEDGGDDGGGDDSIGGIMLRLLPLSTVALALATFGVTGLAIGAVGTATVTTLLFALVAAAIGGVLNSTVFSYLRRSDSTTSASDDQLSGAVGRVVLPVGPNRRGRVAISVGDQQIYLSAQVPPGEADTPLLDPGDQVLVVEVREGIAVVVRLDPELT